MASTGEVATFGDSYAEALLTSMMSAGFRLPRKPRGKKVGTQRAFRAAGNILVSLGKEENKVKLLPSIQVLASMGYKLYATEHTADFLRENGLRCEKVYKVSTKKEPNIAGLLEEGAFDLIINIPTRAYQRETTDGFYIRRKAVDMNVPLITNRQLAEAFAAALAESNEKRLKVKSWSEYVSE